MNLDPWGLNQNTDPSGLNNYPALLAVDMHQSAPPNENWWDKTKRIIGEVGQARNASIAAAAKPLGEVGASLITGTAALGPAIGSMLIPSQESIDNLINGNWNTFINPRVELQSRLNRARQAAGLFAYEPTNPEAKTILKPVNDVMGFLPKYGGEARDYYNSLADQADKNGDSGKAEAWRYLATITDFSAEALNLYALSKAEKTGDLLKEKVTPPEINLGDLSGNGKPYSITQLPAPQEPIVNRVGNPYQKAADAQRIMENKGLADTHEVIPYQDGFALQRKGAQSLPQDLFDPLGLNKKLVTTEETPAPAKTQTAPSAESATFIKNANNSIDLGFIYEDIGKQINRQTAPIRLERGDENYGEIHIDNKHGDEIRDAGYKDVKSMVNDVAANYSDIYEGRKGTLLLAKKNGKIKVAFVELKPADTGDYYSVGSAFISRSDFLKNKKKLWEGAQTLHFPEETPSAVTGQSVKKGTEFDKNITSAEDSVNNNSRSIQDKTIGFTPEVNNNAPTKLPVPQAPIVNRVGNPYQKAADAQSIMENKGLADTHEVIPYESGFALQRKGAQSLLQDLLDPQKLYKEPVPIQETPASAKTQTAPISQGDITSQKNADNNVISEIDGVNVLKVPSGSKIGHGVYTANKLGPLSTTDLYDAKAVSLDQAKQLAKSYYDELVQNPISSPAFNGSPVVFGNTGWSHIIGEHERTLSNDNIIRRLKLLPKVKATLESSPFVDEIREKDYGSRKEYGLLGRFADGDVIRVVVEEQNKNGKTFLSVFDWEDVSKKLKRNTLPESSLGNNMISLGVGKAPSNHIISNITPAKDFVNSKSRGIQDKKIGLTSEVNDNAPTQLPVPQEPIVNRVGNPYQKAADAQRIMENKGLADTHEVIPYESGFALQRKGAQSFLQELLDPLKLYKEPVPTQETPASANTQTAPSMPDMKTKEPWQMTPEELSLSHRTIIEKALLENKPVPAEVLKDYPDLAIEHGKSIIDQMIKDHTDKPGAMYRDDVGTIEFPWGKEGNPKKKYSDGNGISHIIAKRNSEGLNGEEIARMMPEVIVKGEIGDVYGTPQGQRVNIKYGDHEAVLSLYKKGKEETWLLTGWKERTPGVPEESNNLQDYAHQTSGSRSDVGAGVDNNLTPANDSVNSKHNKEGKNSRQGRIVPRGRINGQY